MKIPTPSLPPRGDIRGKSGEADSTASDPIVFSLKDFDRTQGERLREWHDDGRLPALFDKMIDYSRLTLKMAESRKFKSYGKFTDSSKTDFTHPPHVSEDANWSVFHVTGKAVVVGHIIGNIFYVVFLDKNHRFYKTDLKNT